MSDERDASNEPRDAGEPSDPEEPRHVEERDADTATGSRETVKAALLWGVIAALGFLVLVQGYQLLDFGTIPMTVAVVATAAVFVVTTLLTYIVGP